MVYKCERYGTKYSEEDGDVVCPKCIKEKTDVKSFLLDWTLSENKEEAEKQKQKIVDNELNDITSDDLEVREVSSISDFPYGVYLLRV